MKRTIAVMLLLPVVSFAQPSLTPSAETNAKMLRYLELKNMHENTIHPKAVARLLGGIFAALGVGIFTETLLAESVLGQPTSSFVHDDSFVAMTAISSGLLAAGITGLLLSIGLDQQRAHEVEEENALLE